jgi:hypothetical protein
MDVLTSLVKLSKLPQTHQPVASFSHGARKHEPRTDYSHEDRHNIQETENNPPKDNKKPQKDLEIKSPPKQSAPASAKVSKRKSTAKTKAEGNQAIAKLEDQGNWSDEDTKLLLKTLLGSDSQLYEKLMVNAKYVYKKVIDEGIL